VTRAGTKTVRFTKVVERSGEPHVHTLWLPPEKDPELKKAEKAGRVMTVERSAAGGKTDVGFVGFNLGHGKIGEVLIFPKSLKRFAGARVIGIKFDLIAQPKFAPARAQKNALTVPASAQRAPAPPTSKPPAGAGSRAPTAIVSDVIPFEPDPPRIERGPDSRTGPVSGATKSPPRTSAHKHPPADIALIREIRAAMKDLKRGKSVAAYERLASAIADQ
jgi:hypothetical protein